MEPVELVLPLAGDGRHGVVPWLHRCPLSFHEFASTNSQVGCGDLQCPHTERPGCLACCFDCARPLSWFWRLLRNLRILTPICMQEQQRHVKEQYAPSTTYVLAWLNQYTQGMWPLLLICVPFAFLVETRAERLDASSWEFYTLQAAWNTRMQKLKHRANTMQLLSRPS